MDPSKLPGRALIDTGVLTRAIGDLPPDAETPICQEFWSSMLAANREILIAAPSVAEIMRLDGKRGIPRSPQIEVVAFDQPAAEILGRQFPITVLKQHNTQATSLTHLKYDALIVACAVRYNAECIVSIDDDHFKLAAHVNLAAYRPDAFRVVQLTLSEHIRQFMVPRAADGNKPTE